MGVACSLWQWTYQATFGKSQTGWGFTVTETRKLRFCLDPWESLSRQLSVWPVAPDSSRAVTLDPTQGRQSQLPGFTWHCQWKEGAFRIHQWKTFNKNSFTLLIKEAVDKKKKKILHNKFFTVFGPGWNISPIIGWTACKSGTDESWSPTGRTLVISWLYQQKCLSLCKQRLCWNFTLDVVLRFFTISVLCFAFFSTLLALEEDDVLTCMIPFVQTRLEKVAMSRQNIQWFHTYKCCVLDFSRELWMGKKKYCIHTWKKPPSSCLSYLLCHISAWKAAWFRDKI